MAKYSGSLAFNVAVCRALGLDPNKVLELSLYMTGGGDTTVDVKFAVDHPDPSHLEDVGRFRLVPAEEGAVDG